MADQFGYESVDALIDTLRQNPDPVVKQDAANKAQTVSTLDDLQAGIQTLSNGHYYEKAWYMFAPQQHQTLRRVLTNFSPSIPLAPEAVLFSLITAIAINMVLWAPYWCACRVRNWRHHRHAHS
mgnify:CR=1 FL=1